MTSIARVVPVIHGGREHGERDVRERTKVVHACRGCPCRAKEYSEVHVQELPNVRSRLSQRSSTLGLRPLILHVVANDNACVSEEATLLVHVRSTRTVPTSRTNTK